MPRRSPQHALARRALAESPVAKPRLLPNGPGWLHHGIAALGISVAGLGVAASAMPTAAPEQTQVAAAVVRPATPVGTTQPAEFNSRREQVSRSTARVALNANTVKKLAHQRAAGLDKAETALTRTSAQRAAAVREKQLQVGSAAVERNAARIRSERLRAATAKARAARTVDVSTDRRAQPTRASRSGSSARPSRASLPLAGGYTIAARFGQVGSWSRYHTGQDFAAPVGTPIRAVTSGVVTVAGSGPASGWAGSYVTIKHADGTSSLYAHMSTVSVSVGQSVSGGRHLGDVGMTGRTFGPHLHFEVYPAGVTPGDVYRAVNPQPWMAALGLRP